MQNNEIHVITDREGNTYIKRVTNNLRIDGTLTLTSDNSDQVRYRPFSLPEENIFNIWAVDLYLVRKVGDPTEQRMTNEAVRELKGQFENLSKTVQMLVKRSNSDH